MEGVKGEKLKRFDYYLEPFLLCRFLPGRAGGACYAGIDYDLGSISKKDEKH